MTDSYQGPLGGLNVIDFGHYYAGPMAGMLLADQGANVVRIVKPGDKELPEQQYRLLNRNKKLLELNLKTEEGKSQALFLIEKADVVIENFRPGVMKRLELDYASVKASNPSLVYLSLPGFASTDKERVHIQAWEGILGAASGMYVDVSYVRKLLNFPPVYTSLPVNSVFGGVHGAIAVMAALLAREEHGLGTLIETPLVEAGMTGFVHRFSFSKIAGTHTTPFFSLRTPETRTEGVTWEAQKANRFSPDDPPDIQSKKLFSAMQAFWDPLYRYYICSDDRLVKLACMGRAERAIRLLKALGLYTQLCSEGFVCDGPSDSALDNNILNYASMSETRKQRLAQLINDAFRTKTADEWDELLGEILPFSKVRSKAEYLALEPMLRSGVLTRMDNGESVLTVPGRFVDVGGSDETIGGSYLEADVIRAAQADTLFRNNASLPRIGSIEQNKHSPLKKGDLLKGLKVLDLGTWVAGPMSAYVLAQYGADVVKLDSPAHASSPPPHYSLGKRSILTDLHTMPGQDVLKRLVSWADVVVHNKIDPVAERLGVSQQQLQAINPSIVVGQVSAFGGTWRGGWESRFGLDPIPQAVTGLMASYGTEEEPHDFEGTMIADALSGFGLAFGALLGTWQQRKTGYAGEVRTSLVRGGNYFQLPYMIAENGRSDWGEARGQSTVGEHYWQRMYQCSDGWVYVGTDEDRAQVLTEAMGSRNSTESALEAAFAQQSSSHWLSKLETAGIACHKVLGIDDLCTRAMRRVDNQEADEVACGSGEVIYWKDPPCGHPLVLQAMDWVRVGEDHSWKRVVPAPVHGQHSKIILKEIGYSEDEIAHLIDIKVVA